MDPTRRWVAMLYHPQVPESRQLADRLCRELAATGIECVPESAWEWRGPAPGEPPPDGVVTLGGDGTVLRAVRHAAAFGVPVIGVNFGLLGFLADMEPEQAAGIVPGLLQGAGRVDERMMLRFEVRTEEGAMGEQDALNDVFVGRGAVARAVRLELAVDSAVVTRFVADGLVIASPTGSTAYSMSAGGPILDPGMRAFVVTPVVPHPVAVRPLVVPGDSEIQVRIRREEQAILTADGQVHQLLRPGDLVTIRRSPLVARFLRMGEPDGFYATLYDRLRR
jgi:NAD+ kinase